MPKPIIAIDISLTLTNNFNGIANVTRKVREAFNKDDRFTVINAYFHPQNATYYVIEGDDIYIQNQRIKANIEYFFRLLILMLLGTTKQRRRNKLRKCFYYAELQKDILLKPFINFIEFYAKCIKNFKKPSSLPTKQIDIKLLKKLDFSKIDGFFFSGFGTPFLQTIVENKKKYSFLFGVIISDIIAIRYPQYFTQNIVNDFNPYLMHCLNGADYIVTDSKYVKDDLTNFIKENGYNFNAKNITSVALATDKTTEIPQEIQEEVFKKYNITPNKYATIICTLEPRKNHKLLFDIWRKMYVNNPDMVIPLVICGGYGWLIEKLLNEYDSDPILQKFIILAGSVTNDEKYTILKNARFSLFPSHCEGWGMPITESLQVGTPVISADNSSLPEAGHYITKTINNNDFDKWYNTIVEYINNDEVVKHEREKIANTKLRTWEDFDKEITDIAFTNLLSFNSR